MKPIVLFEDEGFVNLLPLVAGRTVFSLQVGRRITLDRTAQRLGAPIAGVWVRGWLAEVAAQRCLAPANQPLGGPTLVVNGRWVMDNPVNISGETHVGVIGDQDIAYISCDAQLAAQLSAQDMMDAGRRADLLHKVPRVPAPGRMIRFPWDVTGSLVDMLKTDWTEADRLIDSKLDSRTIVENPSLLHVGERARIHATAVIDASDGPIFIGDDVSVGAYAVLEGPLFLGAGTKINPHAWLHGGNAIGPICKIGGEVTGCVIHGSTNKQHEGFLGHSYIGSWVNIGASCVTSNLKNNYTSVKVALNGQEIDSGQLFFGAAIGDHAKLGINSTVPTGAVIGFAASIASTGFLPKFVPSFSWVTDGKVRAGDPLKALDTAVAMMARRRVEMSDEEVALFLELPERLREYERS